MEIVNIFTLLDVYVGETMKRYFWQARTTDDISNEFLLKRLYKIYKDIKSLCGSVKYLDNKGTECVGKQT